MSAHKLNLSEKLIEGYVKTPPSLKEQAITKLAIQLCQNVELKKDILLESESLRKNKFNTSHIKWDTLIEKRSTDMCMRLLLPPDLKNLLIIRIRLIALQLFSWNMRLDKFNLPPLFVDSLPTPSDWTLEVKLDEKKIAERLVQDKRIPAYKRYKIACFYCFELFINSLWKQISVKRREDCLQVNESLLVQLWSYQLCGTPTVILQNANESEKIQKLNERLGERITQEDQFWFILMTRAIIEESTSTVIHCWEKMHWTIKQAVSIEAALLAMSRLCTLKRQKDFVADISMYFDSSPIFLTDILCFMLQQMSKEQRVNLYEVMLYAFDINVLVFFLQWPYLDLLIPLIKELWSILPEATYRDLLLNIANHHSNENYSNNRRNEYMDYVYGDLMVELLKETPNNFKRYVFSDNYDIDTNHFTAGELIFAVSKKSLKFRNIRIFQNIWQHITLEEKRVFLRSEYGESFCCHLVLEEKWEMLNSILKECLPEDHIVKFKNKVLISKSGKETCFQMLTKVNEDGLISWLNWGFSSEQEIFQFLFKVFFKDQRIDFKKVSDFEWIIKIDCLDNVIERYAPSVNARKMFKSRFVQIYSKNMCINFVIHSKWKEVDQYLTWGFPSENARTRFKKWFVKEYAVYVCEYHLARLNLQDAEQFLIWCFLRIEAIEQFRQELFFSRGLKLPWVLLSRNLQDLDSLMKWFKLTPEAIVKLKRQVLLCSDSLSTIFYPLIAVDDALIIHECIVEVFQKVWNFLKWGFTDEKTKMAFKDKSNKYIMDTFTNIQIRQFVQEMWNEFINRFFSKTPMNWMKYLVNFIFMGIVVGRALVLLKRNAKICGII